MCQAACWELGTQIGVRLCFRLRKLSGVAEASEEP